MQGSAPAEAYDQESVAAYVRQLTDFDRRMNTVVVESGILQGVTKGELAFAGKPCWFACQP